MSTNGKIPDFKRAIAKAYEILDKHEITSAPINIVEICKDENVSVCDLDLSKPINNIDVSTISGAVHLVERMILINPNDGWERRRFTIAHEFGHIILEHKLDECEEILYRGSEKGDDCREKEANCFAANILVPESLLLFAKRKGYSDSKLPYLFGVSSQVIEYRLNYV